MPFRGGVGQKKIQKTRSNQWRPPQVAVAKTQVYQWRLKRELVGGVISRQSLALLTFKCTDTVETS